MAHSEKTVYPRIGEEVIWTTLDNGLPVCVVPKKDYLRKYALFATRYGGMDMRFQLNGQWLDTPAGIAHYLEHKMFDTREGNALQELAKTARSPMPSPPTPSPVTISTPRRSSTRIWRFCCPLYPCLTSPTRVWRRSRALSPRRST